jgi:hypothetical protein
MCEDFAAAAAASYTPFRTHLDHGYASTQIPLLDCLEFGQEPFCLIQKIAFKN